MDNETWRIENNKRENTGVLEIAGQISDLYDEFTESVRNLGSKTKDGTTRSSGKMGQSVAHWVGGNFIRTEREALCDKFVEDVQSHLEFLQTCFEGTSQDEIQEASYLLVERMTQPVPTDSDSTSNLMKRAIIGQVLPFLSNLDRSQLMRIQDRLHDAYKRRQMFPVEKEVDKELDRLIREKSRES